MLFDDFFHLLWEGDMLATVTEILLAPVEPFAAGGFMNFVPATNDRNVEQQIAALHFA